MTHRTRTIATAMGVLALLGPACSSAESDSTQVVTESVVPSDAVVPTPTVLWRNIKTGELDGWVLNETTVTSPVPILRGEFIGLSADARIVSTTFGGVTAFWANGAVTESFMDGDGKLRSSLASPFLCEGECAKQWKPIPSANWGGQVYWYNASTGEVGLWAGALDQVFTLPWRCGPSDGCSSSWKPVLVDGVYGVLWHNASTGELSYWFDDFGRGTRALPLTGKCDLASGCARDWRVIGSADVNRDGTNDLFWYNESTGVISTWLLTDTVQNNQLVGRAVAGTKSLSWSCGPDCAQTYKVAGVMTLARPPQPPLPKPPPPPPCGIANQPVCANGQCASGLAAENGVCHFRRVPRQDEGCGGNGESCCTHPVYTRGCIAGTCGVTGPGGSSVCVNGGGGGGVCPAAQAMCGGCSAGDYVAKRERDNSNQCSSSGDAYVFSCATPCSSANVISVCGNVCPVSYREVSRSPSPTDCQNSAAGDTTRILCTR
jgi:hypothetical protein